MIIHPEFSFYLVIKEREEEVVKEKDNQGSFLMIEIITIVMTINIQICHMETLGLGIEI